MIVETVEALTQDEEMLRDLQENYQYVLTDEHQDHAGTEEKSGRGEVGRQDESANCSHGKDQFEDHLTEGPLLFAVSAQHASQVYQDHHASKVTGLEGDAHAGNGEPA